MFSVSARLCFGVVGGGKWIRSHNCRDLKQLSVGVSSQLNPLTAVAFPADAVSRILNPFNRLQLLRSGSDVSNKAVAQESAEFSKPHQRRSGF